MSLCLHPRHVLFCLNSVAVILIYRQSPLKPYREKTADNARTEYDRDLAAIVLADKPDLVVCAGWMSILADTFLDPLTKANVPIINLHPALPVSRERSPCWIQPGLI